MTTAADVAAAKAAQEMDGFSRVPVTDSGRQEADPHQTPIAEDAHAPEQSYGPDGSDDAPRQRSERPKPVYMSPSDEARANIAKRFKRDDEGRVPFNGDPNDPEMLYGKHGRADQGNADADQQPDPQPQQTEAQPEKKFTIKVRGQTVQLTEAELLERASKVEAADSYLAESRDLLEQARQVRRENRERDPADPHRPEDRSNTQDDVANSDGVSDPQHPGDDLESAIDELRYGTDSKEAAEKLRKVIAKESDKAADDRQIQRLIGQDNTKSSSAMKAFIDANPDIANDEDASRFMAMKIFDLQREELVKAGIDASKLPKDNQTLAQWHQFQRIHGSPVSNQEQLLQKAKDKLVSWRGGPSRQNEPRRDPSVKPRVEVTVDRNARRANLPNQPTRTMAPPPQRKQTDQAQPRDRSSVIDQMRAARGQFVVR